MLSAIVMALATIPPSSSAWTAYKPAVRKAVIAAHGQTQIDSILIKGSFALVHGNGFHDVLRRRADGSWTIVCDMSHTLPTASVLQSRCGVPAGIATRLAAEEPTNLLASQGQFTAAIDAEQKAFASATGPQREQDRVRLQQLRTLNQQMQLQQITREQAIQEWNRLQFSWALP